MYQIVSSSLVKTAWGTGHRPAILATNSTCGAVFLRGPSNSPPGVKIALRPPYATKRSENVAWERYNALASLEAADARRLLTGTKRAKAQRVSRRDLSSGFFSA